MSKRRNFKKAMELKKIFFTVLFCYFASVANAEMINPNQKLLPYDVIKIQLEALKNNDKEDNGIKQTWLFAHPKNKMITGPYERFRIMIYGQQYRSLLNHDSHKINLIINTNIKYIFKVEILNKDKNLLFYEWHVEKGSEKNCNNCWFTSVVSAPIDQGNTI